MKRTVRVFCAAFAAALSLSLISGCKPGDATESGTSGSETKKNVTLTLASWEVNALKAPWMAKFTEKHPEIKVELAEEGKWLGTEDLAKLAAANKMPDIINVENIYTPVKNNWLMDISSYYQNDPDKAAIYENFIEFGSIGGKLYVLPSNVFFHGIKVNLTLLEDLNIQKPGYDWTIDDFMNILKASSVKGESIGTNNIIWLMKHLPAQMNDELGWAAYNYSTQTYSLGNEWIETVNKMKDIVDKEYVIWENIDKLGKPDDFEEDSADYNAVVEKRNDYLMKAVGTTEVPWPLGKVAMQEDFSWTLRFDKTDPSYTGFDWDYYPFPSSGAGDVSRPGLSVDYYGITTSCKNPDAAWELIKYMSYDLEGFRDKVGIVNAYDKAETAKNYPDIAADLPEKIESLSLPPINNPEAIELWKSMDVGYKPGLDYMLENFSRGYVDCWRIVPEYANTWENLVTNRVLKDILYTGSKTAADLAKSLEDTINSTTEMAWKDVTG